MIAGRIGFGAVMVVMILLLLWSFGAVFYLSRLPYVVSAVLAVCLAGLVIYWWRTRRTRRQWLGRAGTVVLSAYLLSLTQQPSLEREWAADHARMPSIRIEDDVVTISDFRQCRFRSELEFETSYSTLEFDLNNLDQVWFGVQRFTTFEGIAHTFLCFRIAGEQPEYFCVSVEIRREHDEEFSPVKGFFRQYELIYVIADERDQVVMRTVHRPDDRVYLYPANATSEQVQSLFRDIAARAERLRVEPEFYHSLASNCTNNIASHTSKLMPISQLDPRLVVPGYSDRLAFAKSLIGKEGESFDGLRERCRIDKRAREVGDVEDFSLRIRERLEL